MAAESAPPEHLATAIGWVQTAQRLGPALGPVIRRRAGAGASDCGRRSSCRPAFYFAAFLLVLVAYRETPTRPHAQPADPARHRRRSRRCGAVPHFTLFMATVFGLQLVDRSFGPILPLYLGEIGVDATNVPFLSGMLFTTTAAAAAVGNQTRRWLLRADERRRAGAVDGRDGRRGAALVFVVAAPVAALLLRDRCAFGFAHRRRDDGDLHGGDATPCRPSARDVAFAYLTRAYLVGLAVSPVIAGLRRIVEHARGVSRGRDGTGRAWPGSSGARMVVLTRRSRRRARAGGSRAGARRVAARAAGSSRFRRTRSTAWRSIRRRRPRCEALFELKGRGARRRRCRCRGVAARRSDAFVRPLTRADAAARVSVLARPAVARSATRRRTVAPAVHGGRGTVAIRVPAHRVARALAAAFGAPDHGDERESQRRSRRRGRPPDARRARRRSRACSSSTAGRRPAARRRRSSTRAVSRRALIRAGAIAWDRVLDSLER